MGEIVTSLTASREPRPTPRRRQGWEWAGLLVVVVLAAGLRLWGIDQDGFGNPYYAAAVRSMQVSGSNFFFGSFDPVGFITVDKPPVAIWIQAVSAKAFGFRGSSLLVPQALMGIASVVLIYHLIRRVFGGGAGLLAGLILAIMPIGVAVDRGNLPDPALVLVLLLAAWALSVGAETGRLSYLLLSTALVGVGFNIKMLAAFVVLPTFYLCYLVAAPVNWRARLGHLAAASLVLIAVSLSWTVAVDLTPKDRRPYVGGSRNNSALDLALGYNGIGRILGGRGNLSPGGRPGDGAFRKAASIASESSKASADVAREVPPGDPAGASAPFDDPAGRLPPGAPGGGFGGGGFPPGGPRGGFPPGGPMGRGGPPGGMFGGEPGLLRFTRPLMAGQITWLFPLVILGTCVAATRADRQWPLSPASMALLLWAGWLGTHFVVFSFARGIFHEYYTTIMGPAVAVLAGVGLVVLIEEWRDRGRGYLPMALILTASWEASIAYQYPLVRGWLLPLLGVGTTIAVIGLIAVRWFDAGRWSIRCSGFAAGLGLASVLIGPAYWSLTPVLNRGNAVMPAAQPASPRGGPGGIPMGPPPGMDGDFNEKLFAFLQANRHGERIILASPSSMDVAPIIIRTGEAAVSFGGFLGADPVRTEAEFARMVELGEVRFVMIGGGPGGPPGGGPGGPGGLSGPGNAELLTWVREHGRIVDKSLWLEPEPDDENEPEEDGLSLGGPVGQLRMFRRMRRMGSLYDCKPDRAPLVSATASR